MKQVVHRIAAITATLCIAAFFSSTVLVELIGSPGSIASVKSLIVFPGLFILIPAIAMTAGTGFSLANRRTGRLVASKKKRMPLIGANGLLVLLPSAIYLDHLAATGSFGTPFFVVQGLELVAGATNLTLMSLNIRDGLRLSGNIRKAGKNTAS